MLAPGSRPIAGPSTRPARPGRSTSGPTPAGTTASRSPPTTSSSRSTTLRDPAYHGPGRRLVDRGHRDARSTRGPSGSTSRRRSAASSSSRPSRSPRRHLLGDTPADGLADDPFGADAGRLGPVRRSTELDRRPRRPRAGGDGPLGVPSGGERRPADGRRAIRSRRRRRRTDRRVPEPAIAPDRVPLLRRRRPRSTRRSATASSTRRPGSTPADAAAPRRRRPARDASATRGRR